MTFDFETEDFHKISNINIPDEFFNRIKTDVSEIDSIFGSGILPGSTITITAAAGVGKSVFCLSLAELLTNKGYKVCYSSGEEDLYQIAYNCKRLNVENLKIGNLTNVDVLLERMKDLDLLIIDSFQSLTITKELTAKAKVQYLVESIVKKAKSTKCSVIFIVQINVDGSMKGGTILSHAVDVNIRITKEPEFGNEYRLIDTYKNRFGPATTHSAMMGYSGYSFDGEFVSLIEDNTQSKEKKISITEQRKIDILNMIDPPHITVDRVMDQFNISKQIANNILRDLENDGNILKFGRGIHAIWKNKVDEPIKPKSFLEQCVDVFIEHI